MATSESSTQPNASTERVAFISGHIDITKEQFLQQYKPALDAAIAADDNFILSTAKGTDALALEYLLERGVDASRISVYIARPKDRNKTVAAVDSEKYLHRGLDIEIVEGWHSERDAAMTEASDYDILYVRPEEETRELYGAKYRAGRISGTQKNRERRERKRRVGGGTARDEG